MNRILKRIANLIEFDDYDKITQDLIDFEQQYYGKKQYKFKELDKNVQNKTYNEICDEIREEIGEDVSRETIMEYIEDNLKFYEDGTIAFW